MTDAIQRLREQCELQMEEMRVVFCTTTRLAEQTSELRARCRATRGVPPAEPAVGT